MRIQKKHTFLVITSLLFSSFLSAQRDFKSLYKKTIQKPTPYKLIQAVPQNDAHYVITLKNPFDYKKSFGWRVYFKGAIIPQEEGTFQFTGPKSPETFHIVIAHIKIPSSPAITQLEVPNGINYKHYFLQRKNDLNNLENYRWIIYETNGNKGFSIPENTLIVFLDPSYVDTLETTTWKKETNLIALPTITLTKDTLLEEASIKSVLAALDTDPFHRKLEEQSKTEESIKMSRIG
jgi:hypothetical protein